MSWKETSKRVGEVIGGEVFNPWQHRRFLPAQFERDCREDPKCEKLVRYPWRWSETNSRVIRELKRMGTPETLAIAEEREKFLLKCLGQLVLGFTVLSSRCLPLALRITV